MSFILFFSIVWNRTKERTQQLHGSIKIVVTNCTQCSLYIRIIFCGRLRCIIWRKPLDKTHPDFFIGKSKDIIIAVKFLYCDIPTLIQYGNRCLGILEKKKKIHFSSCKPIQFLGMQCVLAELFYQMRRRARRKPIIAQFLFFQAVQQAEWVVYIRR